MNSFQHDSINKIDITKLVGDSVSVLHAVPADHAVNQKSLMVIFNTISQIHGQHENAPLIDGKGRHVAGVDITWPLGRIYTGQSSIDGLAKLVQDNRILNITVYKFR